MSKLTKFFKHPVMFFEDAAKNKKNLKEGKPKIFVVGFSTWKTYLRMYFSEYDLIFLPKDIKKSQFNSQYRKKILSLKDSCQVFIWGYKAPEYILEFLREEKISTKFVEDGFVRSVQLGATKAPPMSLCLDSKTPYFDATRPSELEDLLNNFDFSSKPELLTQAKEGIKLLLETGVSKYNNSEKVDIKKIYGPKSNKRILVLGQVEDDASIQYGCEKKLINNDVVRLAVEENPGAQVIYKPHPDVMNGHRPYQSNPADVENIALVLKKDVPLANAFETVDHVYTITSLGGFEALLRDIKVTTLGCPFYSGWGLTDDRQVTVRRKTIRTVTELFAIAYCHYPHYFDVNNGRESTLIDVVDIINKKAISEQVAKPTKPTKPTKPKGAQAVRANRTKITVGVPTWFNPIASERVKSAVKSDKPICLYMPWIAEHGNALIDKIQDDAYTLVPFDLVKGDDPFEIRREIFKFAREYPDLYRKMVLKKLIPIKNKVKCFIFTFDWAPVMRIIVNACKDLGIKTVLIPHESVFVDKDKYYWCPVTKASLPVSDVILAWGTLQSDIFISRGYEKENIISVGAPKFDAYYDYKPQLTREQFCTLYGLNSEKKIVLFASQPLDSQLDTRVARESQRQAIEDVMKVCQKKDMQLIVRLPPSKDNILGMPLQREMSRLDYVGIDDAQCYVVKPEEAVFHSDMITSINSTMLFEGVLLNKIAFSMKYVEFDQIWQKVGIPAVSDIFELEEFVDLSLNGGYSLPNEGLEWAANMFSVGKFDGKASQRIKEFLVSQVCSDMLNSEEVECSQWGRLIKGRVIDVIGMPSSEKTWSGKQLFVQSMLNARERIDSGSKSSSLSSVAAVDVFFQWGVSDSEEKNNQKALAKALGKPVIFLEDGFIRSSKIGLSGDPALSIIADDVTAYYDATKASRLEKLLNSDFSVSREQIERCSKVVHDLVFNKITKYNHAPVLSLNLGSNKRKILLVDQRFDDQSVISGYADEASFDAMLQEAVQEKDVDIIIKQHPDAISGQKTSYFCPHKLAFAKHMDNVFVVDYDVNPYSLFELVDEVRVVTSGMGFEALLAGKNVKCYGAPFYSGWGVTQDTIKLNRRTKQRSLLEIFYFSYILLSKYYSPELERRCELEELVSYFLELKNKK